MRRWLGKYHGALVELVLALSDRVVKHRVSALAIVPDEGLPLALVLLEELAVVFQVKPNAHGDLLYILRMRAGMVVPAGRDLFQTEDRKVNPLTEVAISNIARSSAAFCLGL